MTGLAVMFDVRGLPIPQGHVRAFANKHTGRIHYAHGSPGLKDWRAKVEAEAHAAMVGPAYGGPVHVGLSFYMRRPKDQVNARGLVKPSAPQFVTTRPDLDRLARAILDAITGPVILDDAQVVVLDCGKAYAQPGQDPGCHVFVASMLEAVNLKARSSVG